MNQLKENTTQTKQHKILVRQAKMFYDRLLLITEL